MTEPAQPLVRVRDLRIAFGQDGEVRPAVDGIDLEIPDGATTALAGESGSGKSVTALSLTRLVPCPPARILSGRIEYRGRDVLEMPARALRAIRGREIAYIFQEPSVSLNPVVRVGDQIREVLSLHRPAEASRSTVVEWLDRVGIPDPGRRERSYPNELSGGMQQRVMIAMALAGRPRLLVADEPTTALDVTIQAQIMSLLADLQADLGMAVLLITHNLALLDGVASRVAVMREGRIVEEGPAADILHRPGHDYTRGLIKAIPRLRGPLRRLQARDVLKAEALRDIRRGRSDHGTADEGALLHLEDVHITYGKGRRAVEAVRGVAMEVRAGESVGLVGESGCGKTSLARAVLGLVRPEAGRVSWRGRSVSDWLHGDESAYRRAVQMVFQDPYGSLNPRVMVGAALMEVLAVHGVREAAERTRRAAALLTAVGLGEESLRRYPHEFSGGQRQRIGIARALAVDPELLIADEPVSALDVSVQAQILNLLRDLQSSLGVSLLLIAHDLAVVRYVCDRVLVMNRGVIVESGPPDEVYANPRDPYTRQLLAAVPEL